MEQHLNNKGTWFVGTTKSPADISIVKKNISEFFYYAYIMHKPDEDDDRLHIHYIVQCNGTRTIKSVASTLGVSGQYIQVTKQPRGANRYLIHLDDPEKEQYSESDVITSNKEFYHTFLTDNCRISAVDFYDDLKFLREGKISQKDFVKKYEFHINKLPFYQRIKTLEVIMKMGN